MIAAVAVVSLYGGAATARTAGSPIRWGAPRAIDTAPPFGDPAVPASTSCPTATECLIAASGGWVLATTDPTGGSSTWHGTARIDNGQDLASIACPSASLCVVVDKNDNAFSSTDPTGPPSAWKRIAVKGHHGFNAVACPSASLCVLSDSDGAAWVATDPAGGAGAWHRAALPKVSGGFDPEVLACASASECVMVGIDGTVVSSTNPTGGSAAWTRDGAIAPQVFPDGLACPSVSLCILTTNNNTIVTSTTPAGPASSWHATAIAPDGASLTSIACTSATACVATDDRAGVHVSADPAGGTAAWTTATTQPGDIGFIALGCTPAGVCVAADGLGRIETSPSFATGTAAAGTTELTAVTCRSAAMCVAVDNAGNVLSTHAPAGTWAKAAVLAGEVWQGVSCPSVSFCAVVGQQSEVATTRAPFGPESAWSPVDLGIIDPSDSDHGPIEMSGVACPSVTLCIAGDSDLGPVSTNAPAGGKGSWRADPLGNFNAAYAALSPTCPSTKLCFVVPFGDGAHGISYTRDPSATRPAWRTIQLPGARELSSIACVTTSLCVAADRNGELLVSRRPTTRHWTHVRIAPNSSDLQAISCGSEKLCVVVDKDGDAFVSTSPAGPARAWHRTTADPGALGSSQTSDFGEPTKAISCAPPKGPCVIVDSDGRAVVGR